MSGNHELIPLIGSHQLKKIMPEKWAQSKHNRNSKPPKIKQARTYNVRFERGEFDGNLLDKRDINDPYNVPKKFTKNP